jgi:hypothetical protein
VKHEQGPSSTLCSHHTGEAPPNDLLYAHPPNSLHASFCHTEDEVSEHEKPPPDTHRVTSRYPPFTTTQP